jgi:hypothetical protein
VYILSFHFFYETCDKWTDTQFFSRLFARMATLPEAEGDKEIDSPSTAQERRNRLERLSFVLSLDTETRVKAEELLVRLYELQPYEVGGMLTLTVGRNQKNTIGLCVLFSALLLKPPNPTRPVCPFLNCYEQKRLGVKWR